MSELITLHLEEPDLAEPDGGAGEASWPIDDGSLTAGVREDAQASATSQIRVHKARLQDARDIFDLVNSLSGDGTLLRRNYAEICENIRDFTVAERFDSMHPEAEPDFLGCGALHLYGPHLAEVRSIVMRPEAKGIGAGGALLRALVEEAAEHQVMSVCLFTRIPEFFDHFGFRVAERNAMPDKIYKDCQTCPRLYACDEVAMVRGPLPNVAVLGPKTIQRPELIQINPLQLTGTR